MIELTEEQRKALLAETPPRMVDPATNTLYVLIPAEVYEKLQALAYDFDIREAYPLMDEVAAKEGWNDPEMDDYDRYKTP